MKSLLIVLIFSTFTFAHEGHDVPGAIPPAPHGGVISEAKHMHHGSHDHDHHEASKREIFFEGRFNNNQIEIYALELDSKTHKTFITLDNKKFSKFNVKVIDARKKKTLDTDVKLVKKHWTVKITNNRVRRFFVDIHGLYDGAKYKARIQVERK